VSSRAPTFGNLAVNWPVALRKKDPGVEGRLSFLIHDSRFHGPLNHDLKRGIPSFGDAVARSSDPDAPPCRLPRTPFPGSLHDCWWEGLFPTVIGQYWRPLRGHLLERRFILSALNEELSNSQTSRSQASREARKSPCPVDTICEVSAVMFGYE